MKGEGDQCYKYIIEMIMIILHLNHDAILSKFAHASKISNYVY